ncbi:MTOR-associated protein MEAK7 [Stomoxys calcitrans]|uniref:MTOR-associated protein MEAK7 n=1 Tax=Stomoxys calcitrans TaxID=35570 RepID=A0A1I8NY91_STOCA|nr:MTOR-associated protein MEAK7 [Stomoxys calcitrans]
MGNQQTKRGKSTDLFTGEELKILENSFRVACGSGHTDKITENKLVESWSSIIDKNLAQFTANFLFTQSPESSPQKTLHHGQHVGTITFRKYAEPYYIVERGTLDEQVHFIHISLGGKSPNDVDLKQLEMYITSILLSYLHILKSQNSAAFDSWHKFGYHCNDRSAQCFAKGLIRQLYNESEASASVHELEKWIQINPTFLIIWRNVFSFLYGYNGNGKISKLGNHSKNQILPLQEGLPTGTNYSPILDIPHVIFVNSNMPVALQNKWRFLFSSKIMGESFSTMLGKMLKRGPTLLVIEDEDHYIFAGYAPHSWALGPNFTGDDSAMLFTLSPAMRCFNTTGYNDHYQYLNLGQQTMPNGLGMGGQFNYWGLWLDCEYGVGQSCESCTTFKDYTQLSKRKEFRIRNLEVWGIGDEPKQSDDSDEEGGENAGNKRSILDKNLEDRVMLELSGRNMHSDGLRDPDLDL